MKLSTHHTLIMSTLLIACGGEVDLGTPPREPDMASTQRGDMFTARDLSTPDLTTARDMPGEVIRDMMGTDMPSPSDMPADLTQTAMDIPADLVAQQDMPAEEPWPMYSGTACDVDGVQGICLPKSRCPGQSVSGQCPGPSEMQCCLQGCQRMAGEPGQCAAQGMCQGWESSMSCAGPSGEVGCCEVSDDEGTPIASLWNTYYYLAREGDYSGAKNTALNSSGCSALVQVSAAFSDAVCIEGSGRLDDGRVINYASTCSCGRPCPTGGTVCYSILDANQFPWGKGARSNPLVPLRSLAVDRNRIALGTTVYLREWDGHTIPSLDGITGFVHDGCFRADDVGGAIQGPHIDIFSGTKAMYLRLEQDFPTRTSYTSFINSPRCAYLK